MPLDMTSYNLKPPSTFPGLDVMEKKAARKKLLEEDRKRRYQNAQIRRKHQEQVYNNSEEYRDYQKQIQEEANLYPGV